MYLSSELPVSFLVLDLLFNDVALDFCVLNFNAFFFSDNLIIFAVKLFQLSPNVIILISEIVEEIPQSSYLLIVTATYSRNCGSLLQLLGEFIIILLERLYLSLKLLIFVFFLIIISIDSLLSWLFRVRTASIFTHQSLQELKIWDVSTIIS